MVRYYFFTTLVLTLSIQENHYKFLSQKVLSVAEKTLLSTECYERLIKISDNEIIDTAAI
jgi:hypothetical protein